MLTLTAPALPLPAPYGLPLEGIFKPAAIEQLHAKCEKLRAACRASGVEAFQFQHLDETTLAEVFVFLSTSEYEGWHAITGDDASQVITYAVKTLDFELSDIACKRGRMAIRFTCDLGSDNYLA